MSKTSPLFTGNELYTSVCSGCVNELFEADVARFKDTKLATIIACHNIDMFFAEDLYEKIKDNANFSFGNYLRLMNGSQYKAKNFTTFLVNVIRDGTRLKDPQEIQDLREVKWSSSDLKNKSYVIQSLGYDCFDDSNYTDADRKFLFNTLADYITDDILEDPHKLQSVVAIVKTILQTESIDRRLNEELKRLPLPDYKIISDLTDIKTKLSTTVSKLATDTGIAVKGKGGSKANSLTSIMREMGENGFEEAKINIVDIKMSQSYKEIAAMNAKSLIAELGFTSDEYARMVAEQSVLVSKYQEDLMLLEEENRVLRKRIKELGGTPIPPTKVSSIEDDGGVVE